MQTGLLPSEGMVCKGETAREAEWGTVPGRAKQQGMPTCTHSRASEACCLAPNRCSQVRAILQAWGMLPAPGVTAGSRGGCQGRPWGLGQLLARCSCHRQTNLQTSFSAPTLPESSLLPSISLNIYAGEMQCRALMAGSGLALRPWRQTFKA